MRKSNTQSRSPSPTGSPRKARSPKPSPKKKFSWSNILFDMVNDNCYFYLIYLIGSFFLGIANPLFYIVTIGCFIEFFHDNKEFCSTLKKKFFISYDTFCMIYYIFLCASFLAASIAAILFFFVYYFYRFGSFPTKIFLSMFLATFGFFFACSNIIINVPISIFILKYFLRNRENIVSFIQSAEFKNFLNKFYIN